jgi:hypothetical protein
MNLESSVDLCTLVKRQLNEIEKQENEEEEERMRMRKTELKRSRGERLIA